MGKFDHILLASDLDGTLLNSSHEISKGNIRALTYFVKNGGRFAVATGRTRQSGGLYFGELPINAPVALMNGAAVYDVADDKLLDCEYLDEKVEELTRRIMLKFPEVGVEISTFEDTYLCQYSDVSRRHFEVVKFPFKMTDIDLVPHPWVKLNFTKDHELLLHVERFLLEHARDEYRLVYSAPYFLELFSKNCHKGSAVHKIADFCGIEPQHIYTAGDNFNDTDLLRCAAVSFAPENAEEEIKKIADLVVSSNDHDTLADVVEYLDRKYA